MKKIIILISTLTLNGCILLAAGAAGGEAGYVLSQENRTASETLTDQSITAAVKTKLLADQEVSGLDINVDTFKSVVSLKGVVSTDHEIDKALQIARETKGVKDVVSKLVVIK